MENLENASLFQLLSLSLGNAALLSLGLIPGEGQEEKSKDERLRDAKHSIEMLEMLQKKTAGNLTADEHQVLDGLLFDLRMKYVEACKEV